jgi:hypothetical protein
MPRLLITLILLFVAGLNFSCRKEEQSLPPSQTKPFGQSSEYGQPIGGNTVVINSSPELPMSPSLKLVADKLQQARVYLQGVERSLDRLNYNIDFEIKAYSGMRDSGRSKDDPACLRNVNRKYFFQEQAAKGAAIRKVLQEAEIFLLQLYDEVQVRGMAIEIVQAKLQELNAKSFIMVQQDYNQIEQTVKMLEEGTCPIPTKDWVIGDVDQYMGFAPAQ